MSTVEDFKNAPVGATATHPVTGRRAMKMDDAERRWVFPSGLYLDDEHMWDFTLDAPVPTTVREALDLAWNLAHEVKPGQVIPADTRFLEVTSVGLGECIAHFDFEIDPSHVPTIRTVEPLPEPEPEPEPDWIDAPAVLATMDGGSYQEVWLPMAGGHWKCTCCHQVRHWPDLVDVIPLYPKEGQDK